MPVTDGIYYSISGRESARFPPILLIHGAGGTHLSWAGEMRRLSGFQILTLDLPGHGRSEGAALQSIEAYAYRLISFLENLQISRIILVGHSMGGAIGLTIAMRRPKTVAGLGLVGTGAFLGGENDILEQLSAPAGFSKALELIQQRAFAPQTDAGLVKTVMQAFARVRHSVLYSDWCACAGFDVRAEIQWLDIPAWVAVGAEDRLTPLSFARFLVDQLPDATLQVIDGVGHMLVYEGAEELVLGLRAFLDRIAFLDRMNRYHNQSLKHNSHL
jgi:pimeloyl-ACP methyl ester carboxylesterase